MHSIHVILVAVFVALPATGFAQKSEQAPQPSPAEKDVAAARVWATEKLKKYDSVLPPFAQALPLKHPVVSLKFHNISVTDEELHHLAAFPKLKRLALRGKGVTDDGLKQLVTLKELERLSIAV